MPASGVMPMSPPSRFMPPVWSQDSSHLQSLDCIYGAAPVCVQVRRAVLPPAPHTTLGPGFSRTSGTRSRRLRASLRHISANDGNQAETVESFEVVVGPNHRVLTVRSCVRPVGRTQRYGYRNEPQSDGIQIANHVERRYFFEEPGGNCLNIFSTPLSRFLMFLSELLESVSLEVPLQISCFVLVSKRSTTTVPTLYVSVVVVASPKPPPPNRLQPQPPPNPS